MRVHFLQFDQTIGRTPRQFSCVRMLRSLGIVACLFTCVGCVTPASWNPWKKDETLNHEYEQARKSLKNPDRVQMAYGRWKADVGQMAEARKSYKSVLQKQPDNVNAILGLAATEFKAGRMIAAEKHYQTAIERFPSDPKVQHSFGNYLAQRNRLDEAIEYLGRAVAKQPENTVYRFNFGEALAKNGQIDAAISHFSLTVGEAEGYFNVGYILNEQGKQVEASRYLARALKVKPSLTQASNLLAKIRGGGAPSTMLANQSTSQGAKNLNRGPANQGMEISNEIPTNVGQEIQQVSGDNSNLTPAQLEQLKNQIDLKDLQDMGF